MFALDPERVWLVEAADSVAAARAGAVLAADPAVAWVEPNRARAPARAPESRFPDDPWFWTRQWGLRNDGTQNWLGGLAGADIHALEAWRSSTGSGSVLLAVADTGVDPSHPELQMVLTGGAPRVEPGLDLPAGFGAGLDSIGHGTAVTGVMAARTGEGAHLDSLGVAGVCGGDGAANPGCRILPLKITTGRYSVATSFDIARAMLAATAAGARAVNVSFAGGGPSRLERLAMLHAITHGCVVVAASGNRGFRDGAAPQYPAAYAADGLGIQVGASDPFDRRAVFSSHGPGLDVVAPGFEIATTWLMRPNLSGASWGGYVVDSGTSYAAPFVTGTVGLMAAVRPELDAADYQPLLRASADDVEHAGVDSLTGWGRLNAARALHAVRGEVGIWHDEVAADEVRPAGRDTLVVGEDGPGTMVRGSSGWAERLEVRARVALPDSFLDGVRVWPRAGGTLAVRGSFRLPYYAPWAEVIATSPRSFELRGYLFRRLSPSDAVEDSFVPLPPDQARFGFTVIGRVDRPPLVSWEQPGAGAGLAPGDSCDLAWRASDPDRVSRIEAWLLDGAQIAHRLGSWPGESAGARVAVPCGARAGRARLRLVALDLEGPRHDRAEAEIPCIVEPVVCPGNDALAAAPNPFRTTVRLHGPPHASVILVDLGGRVIQRGRFDEHGRWDWAGRDRNGRTAPPGLYLARSAGPGNPALRLLRLP